MLRVAGHSTSAGLCWLTTGDGGQTAWTRRRAMEGEGDGYQMEWGRGSDKEDSGRGREKGLRRQRGHRSRRRRSRALAASGEKVAPLSIQHLIRHPSTVHLCLSRKGAPALAVSCCGLQSPRSLASCGRPYCMSLLAAATTSGVHRLASSRACHSTCPTIMLGATLMWGK